MATTEELRDDVRDDSEEEEAREVERKPVAAAPKAAFERQSMAGVRNVWTIAKRELAGYFNNAAVYFVLCGSLLALGAYFFLFQSGGFWQIDRASMSRMFDFMPWALALLVIPLVTMRTLAEEKGTGTIELLITMPVKDSEVILGKYVAALFIVVLLLAATLLYPIAMFVWPWHMGALDWGPVWAGYFGLFLFSAAGVAIGMMFSSLTESQIIAFFMTAGLLVLLFMVGFLVDLVRGPVGDAIAFISFQSRFAPFGRGLIDTRAIVYFASVAVITLLVAFRSLESRKWS